MILPWRWLKSKLGSRSIGIEITDTHVKWLEVGGGEPLRLRVADAEPLQASAVDEGRILQPSAVIQALQTLRLRAPTKTKRVHLVLPSSLTMVRFLKLPDVSYKDLKRMLDFELRFNLPLPFENPYYDFMKLPAEKQPEPSSAPPADDAGTWGVPSGTAAVGPWDLGTKEAAVSMVATEEEAPPVKECEIMLVAAPLDMIEAYASLLEAVGLKPASIEIKALSLLRVVERLRPLDPTSTFMSVDITSTYADISIYHNGALRITRNKPMKISSEKAGNADAWESFDFQNACQDLASEIERFINFYRYSLHHREQEIESMVVSGDQGNLLAVVRYLNERFPFEVQALRLELNPPLQDGTIPASGFAGPLGLALRGWTG